MQELNDDGTRKPQFDRIFNCSLAHIPKSDIKLLRKQNNTLLLARHFTTQDGEHGWMMPLDWMYGYHWECDLIENGVSAALVNIVRYCLKHKCSFIEFDPVTTTYDFFPTFDNEWNNDI